MIILGPPLESHEPTRLRAMSKNLQEFAYRCVRCVLSGRKSEILPFRPRSQFLPFSSSFFSSFVICMCVRVYVCLLRPTLHSSRSLAESSIARQCVTSCVVLLSCFPMIFLFYENASCRLLGPFYMPLMSILRLAVFLSL